MSGIRATAATYNIHGGVGTDRRYAPGRLLQALRALEADVIGLQEVDNRRVHADAPHQFDYLVTRTGLYGAAGPNIRFERGDFGNALLSGWPITAVRRHDLTVGRWEPRGALDTDLATPGGTLRVIVTHLGLRYRERREQVTRLLRALETYRTSGPVLLLGDLNHWTPGPGSHVARLTRRFAAGFAPRTYPSWCPLFRLDRVYADPAPYRAEAAVVRGACAGVSDHLPVRVSLCWATSAGTPRTPART